MVRLLNALVLATLCLGVAGGDAGAKSGGDTSSTAAAAADAAKEEALKKAGAGAPDYAKMRVKQLRKVLAARGVQCKGCDEKAQFVAKAEATKGLPDKSDGAGAAAGAGADGQKADDKKKPSKKKQAKAAKAAKAAEADKAARASRAAAAAEQLAFYGGLSDAKELKAHKWRLRDELKAVEARLKELGSGSGGKGDKKGSPKKNSESAGPPQCVKACLKDYDACMGANSAKPSLQDSCRCHKVLYGVGCNTCDAEENGNLQRICSEMGCASKQCAATTTDAEGKKGAAAADDGKPAAADAKTKPPKKKTKKPRKLQRRAEGDWLKAPSELLDPLFDAAKLRAKQLRRVLDDLGLGCVGCSEKGDFVAAVRKALKALAKEKAAEAASAGSKGKGKSADDDGMDEILRNLKASGLDGVKMMTPEDFAPSGGGDGDKNGAGAGGDEEWASSPQDMGSAPDDKVAAAAAAAAAADDDDTTGSSDTMDDAPDPAFEKDTKQEAAEKEQKKRKADAARAERKKKNKQQEKVMKDERQRAKEAAKEAEQHGEIEEVIELDDDDDE
jgi:hypothetical protein